MEPISYENQELEPWTPPPPPSPGPGSWFLTTLVILATGFAAEHYGWRPMRALVKIYRIHMLEHPDSLFTLINLFGWLGESFLCFPGQLLHHGLRRLISLTWYTPDT